MYRIEKSRLKDLLFSCRYGLSATLYGDRTACRQPLRSLSGKRKSLPPISPVPFGKKKRVCRQSFWCLSKERKEPAADIPEFVQKTDESLTQTSRAFPQKRKGSLPQNSACQTGGKGGRDGQKSSN